MKHDNRIASIFKIAASPTRIGILRALMQGPKPVIEVAAAIDQTHSATSHQIAILLGSKLVTEKRTTNRRFHVYQISNSADAKALKSVIRTVAKLYE